MSEVERIIAALGGERRGSSGSAPCPLCQPERRRDQRALSVAESGGRLLLRCHKSACDGAAILAELRARGLIEGGPGGAARPDPEEARRRREKERARAERTRAAVEELWSGARSCEGTVAARYLEEGRGLHGLRFAKMVNTLRFHPSALHSPSGSRLPAMIAQIRGPKGEALGLHRTFLDPDGPRKAAVEPAKMMLGPSSGGAVRFGPDGPILALAEGIETALSITRAARMTTWATLSTSGLKGLALPPLPVGAVIVVCADHDAAGLEAAEAAAARFEGEGRAVSIVHPPKAGADFNDMMRGEL